MKITEESPTTPHWTAQDLADAASLRTPGLRRYVTIAGIPGSNDAHYHAMERRGLRGHYLVHSSPPVLFRVHG